MSEAGKPARIELYQNEEQIERLVAAFDEGSLPQKFWTHHAHLTVGLWYRRRYPLPEAILRVRFGIQSYNEACGVPMTPQGGYHETITLFFLWAISKYLETADPDASLVALTNGLINSRFGQKTFPLEYYSKERLMSWEARVGWVEPDLKPLED